MCKRDSPPPVPMNQTAFENSYKFRIENSLTSTRILARILSFLEPPSLFEGSWPYRTWRTGLKSCNSGHLHGTVIFSGHSTVYTRPRDSRAQETCDRQAGLRSLDPQLRHTRGEAQTAPGKVRPALFRSFNSIFYILPPVRNGF